MNEERIYNPIPGLDPPNPIRPPDTNQEFLIAQMNEFKAENTRLRIQLETEQREFLLCFRDKKIANKRAEEYRRLYMMYFKKYTEK